MLSLFNKVVNGLRYGLVSACIAAVAMAFFLFSICFLSWQAPSPNDWTTLPSFLFGAFRLGAVVGFVIGFIAGDD